MPKGKYLIPADDSSLDDEDYDNSIASSNTSFSDKNKANNIKSFDIDIDLGDSNDIDDYDNQANYNSSTALEQAKKTHKCILHFSLATIVILLVLALPFYIKAENEGLGMGETLSETKDDGHTVSGNNSWGTNGNNAWGTNGNNAWGNGWFKHSYGKKDKNDREPNAAAVPADAAKDDVEYDGEPRFEVVGEIPHDTSSFTQGLTYHNGMLYESTGLYHQSKVRQLNAETGEVIKSIDMDGKLFAEGLTYGPPESDILVQITWKAQKGFVYRASTLELIDEFRYDTFKNGEGWGITYMEGEEEYVVSDGSEYLHFWDASTLEEKRRVRVSDENGKFIKNLNELEYVNGYIVANIWYKDTIICIDPITGFVEETYNFKDLWPKGMRNGDADVLNGISVSGEDDGMIYVTGKKWGKIFKVKFIGKLTGGRHRR